MSTDGIIPCTDPGNLHSRLEEISGRGLKRRNMTAWVQTHLENFSKMRFHLWNLKVTVPCPSRCLEGKRRQSMWSPWHGVLVLAERQHFYERSLMWRVRALPGSDAHLKYSALQTGDGGPWARYLPSQCLN